MRDQEPGAAPVKLAEQPQPVDVEHGAPSFREANVIDQFFLSLLSENIRWTKRSLIGHG